MAATNSYQKTPAHWHGLLSGASLWLGSDHFLVVRNMRFSEEYRRYYYRDIQALQLRPARRLWFPSWVAGVLVALVILAIAFSFWYRAVSSGCVASLLPFLALIAYRSLAQGCACHVVTAVATDELAALRQMSPARKVIRAIAERAVAAQGALDPNWQQSWQDLQQRQQPSSRDTTPSLSTPALATPLPAGALRLRIGIASAVAALLGTLADGLMTLAQIKRLPIPEWVGMVDVLVSVGAAIVALMILSASKHLHWLRNISLAGVLFLGLATYLLFGIGSVENAMPPPIRPTLEAARHILSIVNVTGDFCLVAAAVVLWIHSRTRGPRSQQLAAAVGEL
jgi:hypothetical protein